MIAGFMEECVCVCSLKINLSEHSLVCGVYVLKENCGVQEINLVLIYGVFNFYGRVVAIECVYKLLELCDVMRPCSYDVIKITEVERWL